MDYSHNPDSYVCRKQAEGQ